MSLLQNQYLQNQYLQFKHNIYTFGFVSVACIGLTTYLSFVINHKLNFLLEDNLIKHNLFLKKLHELESKCISMPIDNAPSSEIITNDEINAVSEIIVSSEPIENGYLSDNYDNIPSGTYVQPLRKYSFW